MLGPGVFGNSTVSGNGAFAAGGGARALANHAVALGTDTFASGIGSLAAGQGSISASTASIALGNGVEAGGQASVALGFETQALGNQSLASGVRARALHQGSFVWSDSFTPFESTSSGQFLINTEKGVGINTNRPAADLHVNGTLRVEGSAHVAGLAATTVSTEILSVTGQQTVGGNLFTDRRVSIGTFVGISQSNLVPTAGSTLAPATGYVVLNPAADVTLDATQAIVNGVFLGELLILQGDGSFSVTVPDNANTRMSGPQILGNNDVLTLIWNGGDWVQVSFSNN
jgi:hypothetical protein